MINIIVVKVDKSHIFPVFVNILFTQSINEGIRSVELLNVPKNRLVVFQYYQYTARSTKNWMMCQQYWKCDTWKIWTNIF